MNEKHSLAYEKSCAIVFLTLYAIVKIICNYNFNKFIPTILRRRHSPFIVDATVQFAVPRETRVHQMHRARSALQTVLVIERIDHSHNVAIADGAATRTAKGRQHGRRCCRRCGWRRRWHPVVDVVVDVQVMWMRRVKRVVVGHQCSNRLLMLMVRVMLVL